MNQYYDVNFRGNMIGNVILEDMALYTHFRFTGKCLPDGHLRLIAKYEDQTVDLGVCCVQNNGLYINTKVSKKKLGTGTPRFYLEEATAYRLVEPDCQKPFERIKDLPNARCTEKKGQKYIYFIEAQ